MGGPFSICFQSCAKSVIVSPHSCPSMFQTVVKSELSLPAQPIR